MLAIRLQRIGKKNKPSYRVVISEKKRDLYGKHNEILGSYDPTAKPKKISLNGDRIKYWLSVGAQASPTVHNLLVSQNIISDKKVKAWVPKKKEVKEPAPEAKKPQAPAKEVAPAETKQEEKQEPEQEAAPVKEAKPEEVPAPEAKTEEAPTQEAEPAQAEQKAE